jgi:hypothetical protein
MSLTVDPHELRDRLNQAATTSAAARERAANAIAVAVDVHSRSQRLRLEAIDTRARRGVRAAHRAVRYNDGSENACMRSFRIEGDVDGSPAHARWSEAGLECSPALLERAEIIVAMGDTFDPGGGRPVVDASLDGPLTEVMPTIIRAFSSVSSIEVALGPTDHSEVP